MADLQSGTSVERHYTVTYDITAAALAERDPGAAVTLPAVWSTPDMIAKMEIAAAALVAALLPPDQMTVGARNEVTHLAATPVGMQVRICATLAEVDGRKLTFTVEAFDEKEKVGEGRHIRYVVDEAKFARRLADKRPA